MEGFADPTIDGEQWNIYAATLQELLLDRDCVFDDKVRTQFDAVHTETGFEHLEGVYPTSGGELSVYIGEMSMSRNRIAKFLIDFKAWFEKEGYRRRTLLIIAARAYLSERQRSDVQVLARKYGTDIGITDLLDLSYNPTKHAYVSVHTRVSDSEKASKKLELQAPLDRHLILSTTDPIVRWYGWRSGDLIQIRRKLGVGMLSEKVIYRVVFNAS